MPDWRDILPTTIPFDPAGDAEAFLKSVPAKWVVYLFADEQDRPVQLLCVRNLRASLKRRLIGDSTDEPSRRMDYRAFIRHVHWARVDSVFDADLVYLEAARRCFPNHYTTLIAQRPAWFLHVNPESDFPRYVRTTDVTIRTGTLLGPLEEKSHAGKLNELLEDSFDLCRYYQILVQAPAATACAYKEMHKCPAPCDGSISMDHYRLMMANSRDAAIDPQPVLTAQTERMKAAAKGLHFESAGRIKQHVDQLSQLGKGPFRFVKPLTDFRYVALQRGPGEKAVNVFVIGRGRVEAVIGWIDPSGAASVLAEVQRWLREFDASRSNLSTADVERLTIVTSHLFSQKQAGVFLHTDSISEKQLLAARQSLAKQVEPPSPEDADDEGIVREANKPAVPTR